ncbi:S-adenosyl-L-methionine-dependent methyltransferase [Phlyctochytrium arcticum]|nr:S-adenosyl-L-methionine-dependent methyltransferase [Phlyctochytrium arcticum]
MTEETPGKTKEAAEPILVNHIKSFPQSFLDFLQANNLSTAEYALTHPLPRYIRFKPPKLSSDLPHLLSSLSSELHCDNLITPVPWLPDFYALPPETQLASLSTYKTGKIYGMCVSSGLAVHALDVQMDDNVLDLCCAPGMKLCYIADKLGRGGKGTVTGVDICKERAQVVKSIMRKYGVEKGRLFLMDGTTFDVWAPWRIGGWTREDVGSSCSKPSTTTGSDVPQSEQPPDIPTSRTIHPFHSTRLLRSSTNLHHSSLLYDKVLVDAECTHDGSIAHVLKHASNGWDPAMLSKFLNDEKLASITTLQRALLENGYRLTKPGGLCVYSTCSFSKAQNEDVLAWFLKKYPGAIIERIPGSETVPTAKGFAEEYACQDVDLRHVLRLSPQASQTSGLVIARIRKTVEYI